MALLDTPICDFGWKAPNFDLKDPNGTAFNLKGSMGENGLLVAFLCNHCPYVKTLATRLGDDARALREIGVNVVGLSLIHI